MITYMYGGYVQTNIGQKHSTCIKNRLLYVCLFQINTFASIINGLLQSKVSKNYEHLRL